MTIDFVFGRSLYLIQVIADHRFMFFFRMEFFFVNKRSKVEYSPFENREQLERVVFQYLNQPNEIFVG